MRRAATRRLGENFAPTKNFAPVTEQEAAQEFSAVILPFSVGQLAQATGRSKETAKCWKAGRAFPNGVSLMALVAEFPQIRAWANRRTGGFDHPQSQSEGFALLERIMASNTAEGRAMRARLLELSKGTGA
jgi:hypothetical protein